MKITALIIGAISATGLALLFAAYYAYDQQSSVFSAPTDVKTTIGTGTTVVYHNFTLMRFEPVRFPNERMLQIQSKVCGGVSLEDQWVPMLVNWSHLRPNETVYRIPCSLGPAGFTWQSFFFFFSDDSKSEPVAISIDNPNEHGLFAAINQPDMAAEYAVYFGIIGSGDAGLDNIPLTLEEYARAAKECPNDVSSARGSEAKPLTVRNLGENQVFIVEAPVVDRIEGSFEHVKIQVRQDGELMLLGAESLGNCGSAV